MNQEQTVSDLDLIFHLEKAIEDNEFEVYYQPIIHTIAGSLCGFEALVRWHHSVFGFLNPVQFIASLEETRQIYHLDIHIVEKVCQRYQQEKLAGRSVVPFSVNLSRVDFEIVDIFQIIEGLAAKYGMPRNMLNIEITESALGGDSNLMVDAIDRFRSAGYQVWMDDFGSGYSSLNTLKDYIFDELKIDMAFLSDTTLRSRRIISSIISMAKEISMVTLAEGVETKEQVEFLKRIGCDRLQGYFFSKPMPYEEILEVLKEKHISFESADDRKYYHEINRINLLSPSPFTLEEDARESHSGGISLAIMEKKADRYSFIYKNEEFMENLQAIGAVDAMDAIQRLVHFGILNNKEIDDFLSKTIERNEYKLEFSVNGDLCSAHARLISASSDRYALLLSINNITQSMNISHEQLVDQSLKNIYALYLRVSILRPIKNEIVTIFSQGQQEIETDEAIDLAWRLDAFASTDVAKDERDAYFNFLDPATLESRIHSSRRGFINTKISTLDEGGEYSKKMYLAIAMGNHEVLLLVRYANL